MRHQLAGCQLLKAHLPPCVRNKSSRSREQMPPQHTTINICWAYLDTSPAISSSPAAGLQPAGCDRHPPECWTHCRPASLGHRCLSGCACLQRELSVMDGSSGKLQVLITPCKLERCIGCPSHVAKEHAISRGSHMISESCAISAYLWGISEALASQELQQGALAGTVCAQQ